MGEARKPTNLSLNAQLVDDARKWNVNLSRAAESGIRAALDEKSRKSWLSENAAALESSNRWVENNDLPLKGFRAF